MPEWLRKLLIASGSLGFADTLQTLAGQPIPFQQMADRGNLSAQVLRDRAGNPTGIGVTPFLGRNFMEMGMTRLGPRTGDPSTPFGEYVLGHEFGHLMTSGGQSPITLEISQGLGDNIPQTNDQNEQLADAFQRSVQFLRKQSTDTASLDPTQRMIMNVLLNHAPFTQHPIAQSRRVATQR